MSYHGYDKDKPRPNAWPYRDYVIRSFNDDKPYARFVEEQIAGDVLYPYTADGAQALGFIAAGPWDFIGHAEVPETKIDGQIARHLDRDDMVQNTITTYRRRLEAEVVRDAILAVSGKLNLELGGTGDAEQQTGG